MLSFRRALALLPVFMAINIVTAAPIPGTDVEKNTPPITQSHEETYKINGKDTQIEKLPKMDQIPHFKTYILIGGWDGKPDQAAIVRIAKTEEQELIDNIENSIKFLKKPAELLYHSQVNDKSNSQWGYVIVTKDMRKNYPKEGAPELARLHEWLNKDSKMDLAAAVDKVREAAIKKAEEMATKDKVVFHISPYNVWTNKEHDVVYFDVYLDAVNIKDGADSGEGKKALDDMRTLAKRYYTEESVRKALKDGTDEPQ